MSKSLEVLFTPAEYNALSQRDLSETVCVVFDVLRATSTMVTALANGATAIIPVAEISEALAIRQRHPSLRRRRFFRGDPAGDLTKKDVAWIRPDGREMAAEDWSSDSTTAIGMLINGEAIDEVDEHGHPVTDDTLLLILTNSSGPGNLRTLAGRYV